MNYYSHHIGDHMIDTAHLSILEDGVYRRLMDRYYTTEAPLTVDETALFRVIRARSEDEQAAVRSVLAEFFKLTESGWTHERCDLAIEEYQVKADANRKNGAKGGRPKKTETKPTGLSLGSEIKPNDNPTITLTNNQEPITKTPLTPQGGKPARQSAISLKTFLDDCKAEGVKPVPEDDPVFEYANEVGISQEVLRLQWCEFRDRYQQPGAKRYKDWRSVFRKSVRGNWFRLWYADESGYALTTTGKQAKKLHEARA